MKFKVLAVVAVLSVSMQAQAFNFGKLVGSLTGAASGRSNNSYVEPAATSVDDSGYVQAYMETINRARYAYSLYEVAMRLKGDTAEERAHLASLEGSFVSSSSEAYDQLVSIDDSVVEQVKDSYKNVSKLSDAEKAKALEAIDMYRSAVQAQREKKDALVNFWVQHGISSGINIAQSSMGGDVGSIIGAVVGTVASSAGHYSKQKELAAEMDRSMAISESVLYEMDQVEEMIKSGEGALSEENLQTEFTDEEEDGDLDAGEMEEAEGVFEEKIADTAAEDTVAEDVEEIQAVEVEQSSSETVGEVKLGVVEEKVDLSGKHPDFVQGYNDALRDKQAGSNNPDYTKSVYYIDGYQQGFWSGN